MSDSYKAVLDRDSAIETAKHFKDVIDLLNELLDYGTSLVPRAYVSSPRDLKAICMIFMQLRQFLVHLDGVAILATTGNCSTGSLQLRSLLETAHAMEWLLRSDTQAKVHHLYVANLRRRRQWNSVATPGTPEATRNRDATSRLSLTVAQIAGITDEIQRIDKLLARAPFDTIDAKFQQHYTSRGYDKPWYDIYGVASIRKIADEIGRLKEYSYIYSPFSGVAHGNDMWKSIVVGDQNIQMNPVREPHNIPKMVQLAVSLALRVYRMILLEYRPGEEVNFKKKYLEEWRTRFWKEYHVELFPTDIMI